MAPLAARRGARVAFYDFDGTLVSGNVVTRYLWFARHHPRKAVAVWRYAKAVLGIPVWLILDACSRRLFNVVFFRLYRGFSEEWLRSRAVDLFEAQIKAEQFKYAKERVALDRAAGYHTVLVTGGIDIAVAPAAEYFGFDDMLANRLEFIDGVATGEVAETLLAGEAKAEVLRDYASAHGLDLKAARAYSDSGSDLPMLHAVGMAIATNPDAGLRRAAQVNGWATLDLKQSTETVHPFGSAASFRSRSSATDTAPERQGAAKRVDSVQK